jgi:N-acetylmuramoyl-L-alanine amidase
MLHPARRQIAALLGIALLLSACGPSDPSASEPTSVEPSATSVASAATGEVVPAPGSSSSVYEPNPGAIVVAIDPGHGGCLDWGVPDPLERGVASSEKVMTLAIGMELRRLLEEQGITAVMTRETDVALAGDDYPDLGCHGPPFRDVNGDGETGFDPEGKTRMRDELQARLDLVNLARPDVLISIHINSLTQNGVVFEIAATQTYYTDETPWGPTATERLAQAMQDDVVIALEPVASYERQDRGISAVNFYIVAPTLFEVTPERTDPLKQPTRGALMPAVLSEVGSITLPAEHDLLLSPEGQAAAAQGLANALTAYLSDRPMAVRFDALLSGGDAGTVPLAVDGNGPPFWAPELPRADLAAGLSVRLTNTGTEPWPDRLRVLAGWEPSAEPYLRRAPAALDDIGLDVPLLAPGESVVLVIKHEVPVSERGMLWVTLANEQASFSDLGSAPLQLSTTGP